MGTAKQLLQLGNKAVVRHCVDAVSAAGIGDIVVVCGAEYDACAGALESSGATIVKNDLKDSEMADSVRIGIQALEGEVPYSGVLIFPSDHPLVTAETCRTILKFHREMPGKIIVPAFKGKRGHPSLFPDDAVCEVFFTTSLRHVVREDASRVLVIDVPDEGVILDMDTEEHYRTVIDKFAARADGGQAGENHVRPK